MGVPYSVLIIPESSLDGPTDMVEIAATVPVTGAGSTVSLESIRERATETNEPDRALFFSRELPIAP
jgi:hypothetical protein